MAVDVAGLRILLSTDAVGGVWTYSLDLARQLSHAGVEIVLAVLGPPPRDEDADAACAIPGLSLRVTGLPLDWTAESPDALLDAGEALAELAEQERCQLMQLHTAALAAIRHSAMPLISLHHSCVGTWWRAVKGDAPLPEEFHWRADLTAHGLAVSDAVVTPTTAFAHAVAEFYGLDWTPLVVRNGREAPRPDSNAGAIPREAFVFASGRVWDEGKNFATLARAARLAGRPVVMAGPVQSPLGGPPVTMPTVRLLGNLGHDQMRHWLARASVYVSPAYYEPFGLGVLEAAQSGCALILSDIPSFRELWSGAALLVPPDDERALARTMLQVLDDPALQKRLSARARHRSGHYTAETMAREMMRIYASLLATRRPMKGAAA